jgi:SAM-dependent methyltransferase
MSDDDDDDVPIRVDFRDAAAARAWIEDTRVRRPYRAQFFAAFCAELAPRLRILELGSGPGQLAREIIEHCDVQSYTALDFSPAMHAIAREHLGDRVTFVTRDFRDPAWADGLGDFDAIVTLQAAHETRHARHLVPLLERARALLVPGGVLLYADHYRTAELPSPLYTERDEQPRALERAGFGDVRLVCEAGGIALLSGRRPAA